MPPDTGRTLREPLPLGTTPYQLELFPGKAYNRPLHYGQTPTAAQRATVPDGMEFDHNPMLVEHYCEGPGPGHLPGYNLTQQERVSFGANPANGSAATPATQRAQGAAAAKYSKSTKRRLGAVRISGLLGNVNSEGGPLLVGDLRTARGWHGVEYGGLDYERACVFFDEHPGKEGGELQIGDGRTLLWEMAGAGTAFIFKLDGEGILVVRAWLHDSVNAGEAMRELAAAPAIDVIELGGICNESGVVIVAWAAEDCSGLSLQPSRESVDGILASWNEEPAIAVELAPGVYRGQHETTESSAGTARRLRISRMPKSPVST